MNTPQDTSTMESPRVMAPETEQLQNAAQLGSRKFHVIPEEMDELHIISEHTLHKEDNTSHIIEYNVWGKHKRTYTSITLAFTLNMYFLQHRSSPNHCRKQTKYYNVSIM